MVEEKARFINTDTHPRSLAKSKVVHSSRVPEPSRITSSTNNKWVRARDGDILIPLMRPCSLASEIKRLNPSMTRMNNSGERGHPCLIPLEAAKNQEGVPLTRIAKLADERQTIIHLTPMRDRKPDLKPITWCLYMPSSLAQVLWLLWLHFWISAFVYRSNYIGLKNKIASVYVKGHSPTVDSPCFFMSLVCLFETCNITLLLIFNL